MTATGWSILIGMQRAQRFVVLKIVAKVVLAHTYCTQTLRFIAESDASFLPNDEEFERFIREEEDFNAKLQ